MMNPKNPKGGKSPSGESPDALLKRKKQPQIDKSITDSKTPTDFDPKCNILNPVEITYKDVMNTLPTIRKYIPENTPLRKSLRETTFGCELYFKIETFNKTGSFADRGAIAVLDTLTETEKQKGIITCSWGNFGIALAYYGTIQGMKVRVVFPTAISPNIVFKCQEYGGIVTLHGNNFQEAKLHAHKIAKEKNVTFINGYDHPAVIMGNSSIGLEIIEELPDVDTILVPIGGGGLIAGIAVAAKSLNEHVNIYVRKRPNFLIARFNLFHGGVEPVKCCCFFKAMEREGVFETSVHYTLCASLGIPTAGVNAFHNAQSLLSKMIVIDDDWITRAVCHLVEKEKLVTEGSGAAALGPLFAVPSVVPELKGKKVVVVLTGANLPNLLVLSKCVERAKVIQGRLINVKINANSSDIEYQTHIFSMIANTGGNVSYFHMEPAWIHSNDLRKITLHLGIRCRNLEHACQIKQVMEEVYPQQCEFAEDPFSPLPICVCYPKTLKGARISETIPAPVTKQAKGKGKDK